MLIICFAVYHHAYKNRECGSLEMPPASVLTNGFVGGGGDPRYIPDFNRMTGTNVRRHGADIIRTPTTSCKCILVSCTVRGCSVIKCSISII